MQQLIRRGQRRRRAMEALITPARLKNGVCAP